MWPWMCGGALVGALLGWVSALYSLWRQAQQIGDFQQTVGDLRYACALELRRADDATERATRQGTRATETRTRLEDVIRGQAVELERKERLIEDLTSRHPDLVRDAINDLGVQSVPSPGGSDPDDR